MRVKLIGDLAIELDGREIARFPTQRARTLLAYIAFHRERAHPRDLLAEMLWPGGNPDAIRLRLNQTLAELRRSAGKPAGLIHSDRFSIRLEPSMRTDVADFYEAVEAARGLSPGERLAALAAAVDHSSGELLAGIHEDWAVVAREAFSEEYCRALLELAELCDGACRQDQAIHYARRAVAINPYSDDGYACLLRILIDAGRQTDAIKTYAQFKTLLREDFASTPSEEICSLMSPLGCTVEASPIETEPAAPTGDHHRVPGSSIEDAFDRYLAVGDAERAIRLALDLSSYWSMTGGLHLARKWLKRALALPQATYAPGDVRAAALVGLGVASASAGRLEESGVALRGGLSLALALGDRRLLGDAQRALGGLALRQGSYRAARDYLEQSVGNFRSLGDKGRLAESLTLLGEAFRFMVDLDSAEASHREARSLRLEIGRLDRAAGSSLNLGILAARRGDLQYAAAMFRETLEQVRRVGSRTVVADCLMEIAGLSCRTGDPGRAAVLLGASSRLRELIKAPLSSSDRIDYVRVLAEVRKSLTKRQFNHQWEYGHAIPLDQAIDSALRATEPSARL